MEKIDKKKIFTIVIFVVVLFIPLIYSYFYLKSYWDPYGNLSDMKVALVNLDEGKDGKNQGKEFVQSLQDSKTFCFEDVNTKEAQKGMEEGKYYATIEIPSDFTKCLESASTTDKQTAKITYSPNQATNYLATQMINSAVKTAQLSLQTKVDKEIIATLSNKLEEVPNSLGKIENGADTLLTGAENLNSGINQINDGTGKLENSYAQFNNGVKSANEGSKALNGGINQVSEGVEDLQEGGKSLNSAITQISDGADKLSSQGEEGILKLSEGINSLNEGAKSLNEGVNNYVEGSTELSKNIKSYIENNKKLLGNVNNYIDSSNSLNTNTENILKALVKKGETSQDPEIQELANKANILLNSGAFSELKTSGEKIKQGSKNIQSVNSKLENGAQTIINNGTSVKEGANKLYTGTQTLLNSSSNLSAITQGVKNLKLALTSLKEGSTALNQGIDTLRNGTASLSEGSLSLSTGLSTLDTSSDPIYTAIDTIHNGTTSASEGSGKLVEGIGTFKETINNGLKDTKEELKTLEGLEDFAETPVIFETKEYGEVNSYGIAFTPLFLCIGLWVGALMCYVIFYYDHENRFGILGINSKNKLLQNVIYLAIGAVEGLITGFLLKMGLGFEVQNIALYYGVSTLIGIAFMSIIQFLIRNFGDVGKFIALIILVLQLAASGGTFPIETINAGFQAFTPFLPMTYCIKLLKEILVPTVTNFKGSYILILIMIIIVTFAITAICDFVRNKKKIKDNN